MTATKRRIPVRVLYNGHIKQFITILVNSLSRRHAAKHQIPTPQECEDLEGRPSHGFSGGETLNCMQISIRLQCWYLLHALQCPLLVLLSVLYATAILNHVANSPTQFAKHDCGPGPVEIPKSTPLARNVDRAASP